MTWSASMDPKDSVIMRLYCILQWDWPPEVVCLFSPMCDGLKAIPAFAFSCKHMVLSRFRRVLQFILYFIFFFNSVLRPFQDYFSSYETRQSVGGAKTGEPREKPPDTPASRTWLVSHVARAGLEPTQDTAVR